VKEKTVRIVEVMGPGCANCRRLEATVRQAVDQAGIEAEIRHVTDYGEIISRGVMSTPGLAVDGVAVSAGRVPSREQVVGWLRADVSIPTAVSSSE
jgi:small redox-active disulfide protein 2